MSLGFLSITFFLNNLSLTIERNTHTVLMRPQQRSQEKNTASHKRDKMVNLNALLDHALGGKKEKVFCYL